MIRCPLACVEFVDVKNIPYRVEICRAEQVYGAAAGWHWVVPVMRTNLSTRKTNSMYLPGNCSLQALHIAVLWIPHWLSDKGIEVDGKLWYDADRIVKPATIADGVEFIAGCTFSCRSGTESRRFQIVLFEPPTAEELSSIFVHMGEIGSEKQTIFEVSAKNEFATVCEAIREVYTQFTAEFSDESAEFVVDGFEKGALSYKHMTRMLFGSTYTKMFIAEHELVNWVDPFLDKEDAVCPKPSSDSGA